MNNFGVSSAYLTVTASTTFCSGWIASSSDPSWITITSSTSDINGNGTVYYTVAPNPSTCGNRVGAIAVDGAATTITQEGGTCLCILAINPLGALYPSSGGTGIVTVTADTSCAWTATSNASWITVTSVTPVVKSPGNRAVAGSGTATGNWAVNYSVAANTGPKREGAIDIWGKTFAVSQDSGCIFKIDPMSKSYPKAGGTGNVGVTGEKDCSWTATSNASWIHVTSGGSGTGNGTVGYSVDANNTGPKRTGTITIAGQIFTADQEGCSYTVKATSSTSYPASGGQGNASVTTDSVCTWAATSNASWIHITSGGSGTGNGTVEYAVDANTGPKRDGTITVGDQTFTVDQASGCIYTISPTSASYASSGGTGNVSVTTGSNCPWTATSNASWIHITSGGSGTGNGAVEYSVDANTGPQERWNGNNWGPDIYRQSGNPTYTLTITIEGEGTVTFTPPGPYAPGTRVVMSMKPAPGFCLDNVIVDGQPLGAVYTVTFADMSQSHTIQIIFKRCP